uniref:Uncharacterized protein n=1 Tax=Candidatus Kentrum eta TaxID=2126337 RepID=A0A450UL25_9GAMM|nr:MAG: hypothetical protein BECKH772A_GA0070896_1004713 [Candidatus Kentron sp. H]VFJ93252.1 MAG: hypothetical protein BECKH772B_GA0070898_100414 [Candidatus Kentron sp. H]VFK00457.1 MAG: hypothetical protein BECKH772C_GA0070978_1004613 [Candidatus Kentron sp. H]
MTEQDDSAKVRRIVGTRLHSARLTKLRNQNWIREWCDHALDYADRILIAADNSCYAPLCGELSDYGARVTVLLVEPWLSVTHPLNTLVEMALSRGATELVLQSSEVWVEKHCIDAMSRYLTDDTLVVGARMWENHADSPGQFPLTGLTSPWNTLALWDLRKLARTGFLTVSSGLLDGIPGGVEEVVTISLLQHMDPDHCMAKIFKASRLHWAIDCVEPERERLHEAKMQSKYDRAEGQLRHLGIPRGSVIILGEADS